MRDWLTSMEIGKINRHILGTLIGSGLAWGFWTAAEKDNAPLLLILAAIFAFMGVKQLTLALFALVKMILRDLRWARYRRKGAKPKADLMAGKDDLKKGGFLQ